MDVDLVVIGESALIRKSVESTLKANLSLLIGLACLEEVAASHLNYEDLLAFAYDMRIGIDVSYCVISRFMAGIIYNNLKIFYVFHEKSITDEDEVYEYEVEKHRLPIYILIVPLFMTIIGLFVATMAFITKFREVVMLLDLAENIVVNN